eukprot:NODE_2071_length_774_cov_72.031724_g1660_i0.p1 GENE.NODE_2071_length_774_cov_72.031724_g1660_i0~~NODE_2071_length_774_cov_72.031724_g1660_i0.p1  ORF type:complete len:238 (-),score=41.85 NODE_2071_length_774_cov_72.031724_g1660_i0:61-705(-)
MLSRFIAPVSFGRSFHAAPALLALPFRQPYASDLSKEGQWPAEFVSANPIPPGEGPYACGIGSYHAAIDRKVNIRRRVPSRVTQMVGGRRARSFSIHFERGSVDREWNQGARMGTEPMVMTRRKLKKFENVADAEAFAVYQGWTINRSNPHNMRFNPRVGSNKREWKQRYEYVKDTFLCEHTGKNAHFPADPHSSGVRGKPAGAAVSARPKAQE